MLLGLEIAGYATPYSGPLPVVRRNPVLGPAAPYDPSVWYQDPHGRGRTGSETVVRVVRRGTSPPRLPGSGAPLPEPIPQAPIYSLPLLFQFAAPISVPSIKYPDQPVPEIASAPTILDAIAAFAQGSGTADALSTFILAAVGAFAQGSGISSAAGSFVYTAAAQFFQGSGTSDATASLLFAATGQFGQGSGTFDAVASLISALNATAAFGQGSGTMDASGDINAQVAEYIYFARHKLRR